MPIIRRTYCIYATLVFFTLHGMRLSGLLAGMTESHTNQQTRQPPMQNEKYQCRIDTVSSDDDGHIVARNMWRGWNKFIEESIVRLIGFIWKSLYRDALSRKHKFLVRSLLQLSPVNLKDITEKKLMVFSSHSHFFLFSCVTSIKWNKKKIFWHLTLVVTFSR